MERFGTPRMSPRPRVAKYGVTHGCHHLRGGGNARLRSSSPPLAEMRTLRMLVTWSGAHFKNRNKNPISSSEVTTSHRIFTVPCPLAEQGTLFAVSHIGEAPPGLGCHRCYSAIVEMRTKGEVISNPGRRLSLCVAPYFADRGVGDMRGPPMGAPKCHPGGGGRP